MRKYVNLSNLRHNFHLYGGKYLFDFDDFLLGYSMALCSCVCESEVSICFYNPEFNEWLREILLSEAKKVADYEWAKKYFHGEASAVKYYFRQCNKTKAEQEAALKDMDLLKAKIGKWFRRNIKSKFTCLNQIAITSYFGSKEEAFEKYFDLYDKYYAQHPEQRSHPAELKIINKPKFKFFRQPFWERPAMFVGWKGITSFYAYWQGCFQVYKDFNVELGPDEQHLLSYFDWIKKQLEPGQTNRTWAEVLLSAEGDEQKAGGRFFELYDEFTALKEQEKRAN
jgi:hypothetical protein